MRYKNLRFTYLLTVGCSRSFKVIDVDTIKSLSLMIVMISCIYVLISNYFYAKRANSGKMTTF